ncbi:cell surface protein [Desulforhabdus sp. TSK]|uniref:cell surface protein n=1 Tax=Desulforhabdus sp. TSK TaxID=2925014 RepID=UPI001FC86A29|nr:cell surface protein [Desulforhabdus sp. TSK]GKT10796.1 merozoite surface protein 3b [Desulforhabdus sp. TSK]
MTNTNLPMPLKYLDKAVSRLRDLGLMPEKPDEAPVVAMIQKVSDLDEEKAVAIARTLNHTTVFNEVVREQVSAMEVGQRYEEIANAFNSIRDDAQKMVKQLEDGEIDTVERMGNFWMKVTRGDIPSRFEKIKKTYNEVTRDSRDQIDRELTILESYRDFRGALKEAQVMAYEILKKADAELQGAKSRLEEAAKALESNTDKDQVVIAKLELARDERLRELQEEDKRYQVAKDLAENLSINYNTTEVIMARLLQSNEVKERVYSQAVTFFGTNETVFTALNASFTSLQGLHESTRTLEVMKEGINQSLETLADVGGKVQEDALRAGYGPTLKAQSVKKLLDSVINFQERSRTLITELRDLSARNEEEIRQAVEAGKRRLVELTKAGEVLTHG